MILLPLSADSQFVLDNGSNPSAYSAFSFHYDPQDARLNATLQISGTSVTYTGIQDGKPAIISISSDSSSYALGTPPGTPVLRVVAIQKPGCTNDCIALSTENADADNTPIIVSDMLTSGGLFNVRAQVTWADVQPSDELALFYTSLLAV